MSLRAIAHNIADALDPDAQLAAVRAAGGSVDDKHAVEQAASNLITEALKPLASDPELILLY